MRGVGREQGGQGEEAGCLHTGQQGGKHLEAGGGRGRCDARGVWAGRLGGNRGARRAEGSAMWGPMLHPCAASSSTRPCHACVCVCVCAGDKLGGTPTVRSKGADINIDAMWAAHRERGGYVRRYDPLLEATQAAAAATAAAGRGDGGVEARNGAGAGGEAFDLDVRPAWPPSPLPPPAADRARMMIGQSQDLTGFSTVNGDHSWPSSPTYPHPQQPRQQAPHPPGLQSHPHSQQHEAAAITPSSGPEQPRRAPPRTHSAGEERGGGGVRAVHKTVAFEQARPAPSRPQAVGLWAGATPDAPPTLLRQVSGPARGGSAPDPVAQQTQALAEKARAAAARYYERHGGTTSPTRYMPASRATASPASPAPADVPLTRYHADTGLTYSPYRSSPSRAGPYSPGGVLYGPPPPAPSPPPALTPVQGADPVGTTSWNVSVQGGLWAHLFEHALGSMPVCACVCVCAAAAACTGCVGCAVFCARATAAELLRL